MAYFTSSVSPGPRVGAAFRLLMQVRLLLVGITVLLLAGHRLSVGAGLAIISAAFCSWLAARYWERIMRRVLQHPILLGIDVVVALAVLELGGPLGPFFLFTAMTSAVAGLLFRWPGVVYFCLLQVACYYLALMTTPVEAVRNFQALIGQPAYYPLVAFVGMRVRRLLDEQARLAEAQRQAEVDVAAANERTRLARELHDSLAKTLRGIAMSARALPTWMNRSPERAAGESERIAAAADIAAAEARGLIADLRLEGADQPAATAVRAIAEDWAARARVTVRLDVADDVDLTSLGRYEAGAVLKEALTNIERHSGAHHVDVALRGDGGYGVLRIHDDGCGFELGTDARRSSRNGHYGLAGMQERAGRAGGTMTITAKPGCGTTIRAAFPRASNPASAGEVDHVGGSGAFGARAGGAVARDRRGGSCAGDSVEVS